MKSESVDWRIDDYDITASRPLYEPFLVHLRIRDDFFHFSKFVDIEYLPEPVTDNIEFVKKKRDTLHML
jgi:hypothetical protein